MATGKPSVHVVPHAAGWAGRTAGATRVGFVASTQAEAVARARETARRTGAELVVHRRDGTIREKNSYGSDPHPPKG